MDEFCLDSQAFYTCTTNEFDGYSSKRSSESSLDFDILDSLDLFETNDFKLNISDTKSILDPDDFLNEDFGMYRMSPSPTNSSTSNHSTGSNQAQSPPLILETPPVSPPISNPAPQCIIVAPKKRILPKPPEDSGQPAHKKTLVLSSKDFKALVRTMETTNAKPPNVVLVTPTPEPMCVLPKPSPNFAAVNPLLKKNERLMKNREAADKSRAKKKEHLNSLENDVKLLKLENQTLRTENGQLRERLQQYESFACKCRDAMMGKSALKKNTAMVFAMLFMITMNIGSFGGLINLNLDAKLKKDIPMAAAGAANHPHPSRNLLWVDEDPASNRTYTNSTTSPASCSNLPLNQTENIRLENDLRKWIDELKYHNLSLNKVAEMEFAEMDDTYFVSKHFLQSFYSEIHKMRKDLRKRTKKLSKKKNGRRAVLSPATFKTDQQLKLFNPSVNNYADFFDEIRRRDDTFYVVSLSGDHLLLPAVAHNVTLRPKMSLMLPSTGLNNNGTKFVTLMQIDCEVLNTSVIKVRERMIPEKLRSKWRATGPQTAENADETIKYPAKPFERDTNVSKHHAVGVKQVTVKPYFVDKVNAKDQLYQDSMIFSP